MYEAEAWFLSSVDEMDCGLQDPWLAEKGVDSSVAEMYIQAKLFGPSK